MTSIEWTHVPDGLGGRKKGETVNPQVGCSEISPGCRNCYAAKLAARGMADAHRGLTRSLPLLDERGRAVLDKHGRPKIKKGSTHWNGQIARAPDQLEKPLRWRAPRGIFWGSMTDLFHESVMADENGRRYIAACFGVMAATPQHTHMVLTKRPDLMRDWFAWLSRQRPDIRDVTDDRVDAPDGAVVRGWERVGSQWMCRVPAESHFVAEAAGLASTEYGIHAGMQDVEPSPVWPLPNVWVGTTVEDQRRADGRIPELLRVPAAVRFLSAEPLLGPVVIPEEFFRGPKSGPDSLAHRRWVIAGGESGNGARPMHPDWARGLRDQCTSAGVPFLFKQWGAYAPLLDLHWQREMGIHWNEVSDYNQARGVWAGGEPSENGRMVRVGKKAAGRELDGRTWDEFPR